MLPLGGLTQEGWEGNQSLSSKETGPASVVVRVSLRPPKTRRLSGEHSRRGLSFEREGGTGFLFFGLFYKNKNKNQTRERKNSPENQGSWLRTSSGSLRAQKDSGTDLAFAKGEKCVTLVLFWVGVSGGWGWVRTSGSLTIVRRF